MRRPPLRLFLLAHPSSEPGRALTEAIMQRFVEPPATGGLRIPTYFTPDTGSGLPPEWAGVDGINLDQAEHTLVVVLADSRMLRVVQGGTGNKWREFFAIGIERAAPNTTPHYCFAIAIDNDGFGLATTQHILRPPAFAPSNGSADQIQSWVRNVVDDLALQIAVRAIQKLDSRATPAQTTSARAPIQLFLSHAKADLDSNERDPVRYVEEDVKELPIDFWFDAAEIPPSEDFADEIAKGIQDCSIVLSFLTDNYSSRPWCQREILEAKQLGIPILVIDALQSGEPRNFPYLGNVPTIHWSGNDPKLEARQVISRAAREALRYVHNRKGLSLLASRGSNEVVLASAPEALTLAHRDSSFSTTSYLYPDPPLSDQELEVLNKLLPDSSFVTPLTKLAQQLRDKKRVVGVSISASDDLHRYGLSRQHERTLSDELYLYLLLSGCQIAYGGILDASFEKGANFTLQLFELVRGYSELARRAGGARLAPIINHAPWPLRLGYGDREFSLFGDIAEYCEGPRPSQREVPESDKILFPVDNSGARSFLSDTPQRRLAWARGLTAMRSEMTRKIDARVVAGGRCGRFAGLYPGIIEEAWMSLVSRQPIFFIGAFGGAARVLIDVILSGEGDPLVDLCRPEHFTECTKLARERGIRVTSGTESTQILPGSGDLVSAEQIARDIVEFRKQGLESALNNGLNEPENLELFYSREPATIAELILLGLERIETS